MGSLNDEQLNVLERLGFKRNPEWDTTVKTLRENELLGTSRHRLDYIPRTPPLLDYYLWDDPFFRPMGRLSLL